MYNLDEEKGFLSSKLENFGAIGGDQVWSGIENNIGQNKKRKGGALLFLSGLGFGLAVCTLFVLFYPFGKIYFELPELQYDFKLSKSHAPNDSDENSFIQQELKSISNHQKNIGTFKVQNSINNHGFERQTTSIQVQDNSLLTAASSKRNEELDIYNSLKRKLITNYINEAHFIPLSANNWSKYSIKTLASFRFSTAYSVIENSHDITEASYANTFIGNNSLNNKLLLRLDYQRTFRVFLSYGIGLSYGRNTSYFSFQIAPQTAEYRLVDQFGLYLPLDFCALRTKRFSISAFAAPEWNRYYISKDNLLDNNALLPAVDALGNTSFSYESNKITGSSLGLHTGVRFSYNIAQRVRLELSPILSKQFRFANYSTFGDGLEKVNYGLQIGIRYGI